MCLCPGGESQSRNPPGQGCHETLACLSLEAFEKRGKMASVLPWSWEFSSIKQILSPAVSRSSLFWSALAQGLLPSGEEREAACQVPGVRDSRRAGMVQGLSPAFLLSPLCWGAQPASYHSRASPAAGAKPSDPRWGSPPGGQTPRDPSPGAPF